MNIKRAKEEIKDTVEAYLAKDEYGEYVIPSVHQRPTLLIGAPGIGKTQIMGQVARECGIGLVAYTITHHTRQSAIGLPFISRKNYGGKDYAVTEYTMSEIVASVYEKIEQTGIPEGILFLDEINCVSETLSPAMLQFLQYKSFGNHKIPEGWIIVAAGNPPEYNKSVREFDVVTLDRVKKIEVEADFEAWKEYAYQAGVHGAVISYLNTRKQYFYQMETTVDGKNFATPRGWEDLSRMIRSYERMGKPVGRDLVSQYIQFPKIAKDFANYLELYAKYRTDYQIDEIFAGRLDEILLKKVAYAPFDERLSVLGLISSRVREAQKKAVQSERFMERLQDFLSDYRDELQDGAEGAPQGQQNDGEREQPDAIRLLSEKAEKLNQEFLNKKQAGLIDKDEENIYHDLINFAERFGQTLAREGRTGREAALGRMRELFGQENDTYERLREEAGQALERAFDFLEAAFGTGQEMVIFITELNSSYYSVKFLSDYACERYFRYNKELLFDERRQQLLGRLG